MKATLLFLILLLATTLHAQPLSPANGIDFYENGNLLRSKYAGGFEMPQFSEVDLNGDNVMDLFVFDRSVGKVITFLNQGTANTTDYIYDGQYEAQFPKGMTYMALLRDFNCDGKMDLFTNYKEFFQVWEWTPGGYVKLTDSLRSNYGTGLAAIPLLSDDIPAIDDIDGDGYLDILTFDTDGALLEWHRNVTFDSTGGCAQLMMTLADACWGKAAESALDNTINLNVSCRVAPGPGTLPQGAANHGGSTISSFDEDGDGDKDLLIGDLFYPEITFLRNGGDSAVALIDSVQYSFPVYDAAVDVFQFAGSYLMDLNNDGLTDLLAAPCLRNISYNYDNVWYYQNIGNATQAQFSRSKTAFLQEEMVDVGRSAFPVFFDQNGDGLLDLLIGNNKLSTPSQSETAGLSLYRNTGTSMQPEYTLVTRNYANIAAHFNPYPLGLTPAVGDMDNDGDVDLMVGEYDGGLHYFENTGLPGDTAIFATAQLDFKGIDAGNYSAPAIADLNRDGKPDLVVGELGGQMLYFENIGTATAPDFSSTPTTSNWGGIDTDPVCCQGFAMPFIFDHNGRWAMMLGTMHGGIYFCDDIESSLGGAFPITDSAYGDVWEGTNAAFAGADIDGDGLYEWVMGNLRGGITIYDSPLPAVSLEIALAGRFSLSPNPSAGATTVHVPRWTQGHSLELWVYDVSGRLQAQRAWLNTGQQSLDLGLRDAVAGVYFVRISVDGQPLGTRKWVVGR